MPSGTSRSGSARTGKPPSSAWLFTVSEPSASTGRLNLTSRTRALPSGTTFQPTMFAPSTPRISPGPSRRSLTEPSFPCSTRSVRRDDSRRRPSPTRTSVCSELVKKSAPCSAARSGFHASEAEPSAGRNPLQPALAGAGDDRQVRIKRDAGTEALEVQGDDGAGRHGEVERAPVAALGDRGREGKLEGQRALALAHQVVRKAAPANPDELRVPAVAGGPVAQCRPAREDPQARPRPPHQELAPEREVHT
jgi:hypothetical protein